jgi:hypothetical protein
VDNQHRFSVATDISGTFDDLIGDALRRLDRAFRAIEVAQP